MMSMLGRNPDDSEHQQKHNLSLDCINEIQDEIICMHCIVVMHRLPWGKLAEPKLVIPKKISQKQQKKLQQPNYMY
jgi:hypothetical protein